MQPLARPGRLLPSRVMCVSESSPGGGGTGLEMKPGGWLQRRQGGERLAGCLRANEQPAAAGRAAGGQLPSPSLGAGSPAGASGLSPVGQWHWTRAGARLEVGVTSAVSSVQDSRARTARRTSTTVQGTTAGMGAPAWTASTPTTASAPLSGQVAPRVAGLSWGLGRWLGRAVLLR